MNNLIICPVGMRVPTDSRWKESDHWRWTNKERNYKTLVVAYDNNFDPEPGSYDYLIRMKGHKWVLIRELSDMAFLQDFDYIGCVDDDLITDYQSFNLGLELAYKFDFQYWQFAMPPESSLHPTYHNCLLQDKSCIFSETTFIEMGSPFFKRNRFFQLMNLLKYWGDMKVGLGLDRIFYDFFQCPANVVHCASIHQPIRESYYDKTESQTEMYEFMGYKYAQILKQHFNRDSHFNDSLITLKKWRLNEK